MTVLIYALVWVLRILVFNPVFLARLSLSMTNHRNSRKYVVFVFGENVFLAHGFQQNSNFWQMSSVITCRFKSDISASAADANPSVFGIASYLNISPMFYFKIVPIYGVHLKRYQ